MRDAQPVQREITETTLLFKTEDGAELVGQLYAPNRPFAAVVVNSATGVLQTFYTHFARWLAAERGMACLTFDYRDTGRSGSGPIRRSRADMVDWGVRDQEAARAALRRTVPGVPMWIIGHSLGAMMLPSQRDFEGVTRVIAIASGKAYHRDHPWPYRAQALMFWFGLGPLAVATCGYMPGKALRFGEDIPSGVYWQWRRWCTSPDFNDSDLGAAVPTPNWPQDIPVRMFAFQDDDLIPPKGVRRLAEVYGAAAQVTVVSPQTYGVSAIGHLGAFSRRNKALWSALLEE